MRLPKTLMDSVRTHGALERLRLATGGAVAVYLPVCQQVDGRFSYGEGVMAAETAIREGINRTAVGKPISGDWDPELPVRGDVNRVVPASKRIHDAGERLESTRAYQTIYAPLGLRDTLRVLVYDGPRCVGWFGVLRASDAAAFSARDLRVVEAAQAGLSAQFIAWSRHDARLLVDAPAHLVCSEAGDVIAACPGARAWLTKDRMRRIREVVRTVLLGTAEALLVVGHVAFRVTVLHQGSSLLLYLNAPLGTFASVHPAAALTLRQREIADLAALGLTVPEIAEDLALSTHTVKQHLRAAYALLGVRRREELVIALERGSRG